MECILPAVSDWRKQIVFVGICKFAQPKLFSAEFENRAEAGGLKGRATKRW